MHLSNAGACVAVADDMRSGTIGLRLGGEANPLPNLEVCAALIDDALVSIRQLIRWGVIFGGDRIAPVALVNYIRPGTVTRTSEDARGQENRDNGSEHGSAE